MQTRILLFEDDESTRNLVGMFLRAKGYEVLDFVSPVTCSLVSEKKCECPRNHACADMIITDMNMPGMTGLELIRGQIEKGCHAPPQNKVVISAALTREQEQELCALGCWCLRKPFKLPDLLGWVRSCEGNIPADRELEPVEVLLKTVAA